MRTFTRRFLVLAVASLVVVGMFAASSQARNPYQVVIPRNSTGLVNPNYQAAPGLSINQYAYNVSVLGRAYSNVPPYALGYNPYARNLNYGPVYTPGYSMYPYGYNPYLSNYSPNPYLYNSYNYNPYAYGMYGYGNLSPYSSVYGIYP